MSFPVKACLIGGLGCVASIAYGLSQAESSLSVREKLGIEGYELISFKDNIAKDAWKTRVALYKQAGENSSWLLKDLLPSNVDDEGEAIKKKCEKLTNIKVSYNSIKDIYEKVIKLCTVTIKEYIQANLNTKDDEEKIIEKTQTNEWKEIYDKHKKDIVKVLTGIEEENHKDELNKFCEETFALQKSNENKDKEYQASQWCVKRKEKPKVVVTKSEDGSDED